VLILAQKHRSEGSWSAAKNNAHQHIRVLITNQSLNCRQWGQQWRNRNRQMNRPKGNRMCHSDNVRQWIYFSDVAFVILLWAYIHNEVICRNITVVVGRRWDSIHNPTFLDSICIQRKTVNLRMVQIVWFWFPREFLSSVSRVLLHFISISPYSTLCAFWSLICLWLFLSRSHSITQAPVAA
jgi:hypothetical protein